MRYSVAVQSDLCPVGGHSLPLIHQLQSQVKRATRDGLRGTEKRVVQSKEERIRCDVLVRVPEITIRQ